MAATRRTIGDVYDLVVEIRAEMSRIAKLADKHEEAIKGNGKPGIETRLGIIDERELKRDRREWFLYTVIVAQVAGWIFLLIQ